jgi:hypothetical protein
MTPSHALFTVQTPSDLLATLAVLSFALLPGLAMGVAVARRMRLGLAAAIAGAFATSAVLASVIMLVGGYAHLSLEAGVAAYLAGAVVLTWWALRLMKDRPALAADLPGLALGAAAMLLALVERPWFKISADTFYHLAAARSLLVRDALVVTDPFHGTATAVADPSSGVLHTMMAFFVRLTGMDMAAMFSGWTVLGAALLALSFYALIRRLAPVQWAATLGAAAYLLANQFLDFRSLGYPNKISLVLVFFGMLMFTEVFETPSWTAAVASAGACVAVSAMHVGNAEFLFIVGAAIAFWALVDAVVSRWRDKIWAFDGLLAVTGTLVAAAVLSLPFILPKFGVVSGSSMVDTAAAVSRVDLFQMGPFVVTRPGRFFDGGTLMFVMTSALALFMAGWSLVKRDRVALSAFAICSLPLLLLVDPPITTLAVTKSFYNLTRIAALLGFTSFVAIAWALARPKRAGGREQAVFLALVALVGALAISGPFLQTTWTETVGAVGKGMNVSVWRSRESDIRDAWGYDTLARVRAIMGDSRPMIAADPETGYYFAGLVDVRLAAAPRSHSPLVVEVVDGPARRKAMEMLLYPTATVAERRATLTKWGVDYVVLWKSRVKEAAAATSMRAQPELFEVVDVSQRLVVLRVKR